MKIFLAGHRGMVGSAIHRRLGEAHPEAEIITRRSDELDLTRQADVRAFLQGKPPDVVILAAAKVGGIHANNTYPAEFIRDNLMIAANVIHESWAADVAQLLQLGASCIYLKMAPQPIGEGASHRHARGDERAICDCQDRGDQALRELQSSIWN